MERGGGEAGSRDGRGRPGARELGTFQQLVTFQQVSSSVSEPEPKPLVCYWVQAPGRVVQACPGEAPGWRRANGNPWSPGGAEVSGAGLSSDP